MHTLDTNAIIYYLKDDPGATLFMENTLSRHIPLYVSTITEIELFGVSHLDFTETERIENILRTVTIIPVDSRIARVVGSLRSSYRLKTADSAIAATALATGTSLVTRNLRDFKKIPELRLVKI